MQRARQTTSIGLLGRDGDQAFILFISDGSFRLIDKHIMTMHFGDFDLSKNILESLASKLEDERYLIDNRMSKKNINDEFKFFGGTSIFKRVSHYTSRYPLNKSAFLGGLTTEIIVGGWSDDQRRQPYLHECKFVGSRICADHGGWATIGVGANRAMLVLKKWACNRLKTLEMAVSYGLTAMRNSRSLMHQHLEKLRCTSPVHLTTTCGCHTSRTLIEHGSFCKDSVRMWMGAGFQRG